MGWSTVTLADGETYEVRHTVDAGFKAKRVNTILWTEGNISVAGALTEASGQPDSADIARSIDDAAARLMEHSFSNIPSNHRG
jgi:hypothetical protein